MNEVFTNFIRLTVLTVYGDDLNGAYDIGFYGGCESAANGHQCNATCPGTSVVNRPMLCNGHTWNTVNCTGAPVVLTYLSLSI